MLIVMTLQPQESTMLCCYLNSFFLYKHYSVSVPPAGIVCLYPIWWQSGCKQENGTHDIVCGNCFPFTIIFCLQSTCNNFSMYVRNVNAFKGSTECKAVTTEVKLEMPQRFDAGKKLMAVASLWVSLLIGAIAKIRCFFYHSIECMIVCKRSSGVIDGVRNLHNHDYNDDPEASEVIV